MNVKHKLNASRLGKVNLIYMNINSIRNKLDELEYLIGSYNNKIIHFIALAETRIKEEENYKFNIVNYNVHYSNRNDGHGGVGLFVHESYQACVLESECVDNINFLCVDILELSMKIGVVYKQPQVSKLQFIEYMEKKLEKFDGMILIGDTNINLLKHDNTTLAYQNACESNSYTILNSISERYSTRVSKNELGRSTKTIIDHIMTDLIRYKYTISLLNTHMSDHKMIIVSIFDSELRSIMHHKKKEVVVCKTFDRERMARICEEFSIENTPNINEFIIKMEQIRNECMKTVERTKTRNPHKPWINEELIALINERNRYYRLRKKSKFNPYVSQKYMEFCHKVNALRTKLRSDYNSRLLNNNINKPKFLWQKFNEIIHNKETARNSVRAICENTYLNGLIGMNKDIVKTDKREIGCILNTYYNRIGKMLYDKININQTNYEYSLPPHNVHTIYLAPTNAYEVSCKILSMKNSNNVYDIVSPTTMKDNIGIMAPLITEYINHILNTGESHEALKITRIVPIFKSGNPLDTVNYRPINILPALSKVIEMVIYDRMEKFCTKYNLINDNQYGFQKHSGTLSATATLINFLQNGIDDGINTIGGCIFIDLKSAFDTIPHTLLLNKLDRYGFRGVTNALLKNYIKDREYYVDIGGTHSEALVNTNPFSVAQGSNLGPLLFLLYINDIFSVKLHGKLILFADDACIAYVDSNIDNLKQKMQNDIDNIAKWLIENKLTINAKKTKSMIISQRKSIASNNLNLKIGNIDIVEQVQSYRYLGLTLQSNLSWNEHVSSISKKISGLCGVIRRLGNRVNSRTLLSIYYACVHSHLSYLSEIWGPSLNSREYRSLQILQNKVIRKIFYRDYSTGAMHTLEIFEKYKIPSFKQIFERNQCMLIYKIHKKHIKLKHMLNRIQLNHRYPTRSGHLLYLSSFRTQMGKNSVFRSASHTYNKYRLQIHEHININRFKTKLREIVR